MANACRSDFRIVDQRLWRGFKHWFHGDGLQRTELIHCTWDAWWGMGIYLNLYTKTGLNSCDGFPSRPVNTRSFIPNDFPRCEYWHIRCFWPQLESCGAAVWISSRPSYLSTVPIYLLVSAFLFFFAPVDVKAEECADRLYAISMQRPAGSLVSLPLRTDLNPVGDPDFSIW